MTGAVTASAALHPAAPGDAPAADRPWRRLDPVDCSWSGVSYVRGLLDLDLPPAADLMGALHELAADRPEIGRWMRTAPPQWCPLGAGELDAWLRQAFVATDEPVADAQRMFDLNAEPLGDVPFRIVAGPSWISLRQSHAVGDGWTADALVGHLLRRAHGRRDPVPWRTVSARRRDLVIGRELAGSLPALVEAVRRRQDYAGGRYEPWSARAAGLTERTVSLVSPDGFTARLRRLRDELHPGASAAAVAMVGLRRGLAATLPAAQPGFECLFNTRRGATADRWGNWSVGVYIRPGDDHDPVATAREMTRVRERGLPAVATASMRARAARSDGATVSVAAPTGRPRLTMSYIQQHATADVFPGQRPGRSVIATETRPNGVESVTVQGVELAGRLCLSVSFYPEVWSRAAVETAAQQFFDDPRGCVTR